MKAMLLNQIIGRHEAFGNDIAHMSEILGRKHEVAVYCDNLFNPELPQISREELIDIGQDEQNLLIYHHNNYWEEGEEILDSTRAKVIVKYHNITPASFFEPYSEKVSMSHKKGREQTRRIL